MKTNRRSWIKQIGIGASGIALAPLSSFAVAPANENGSMAGSASTHQPIILRSNENPYGPSPLAKKAIADHIGMTNRYQWDIAGGLIAKLAQVNKVSGENILLGAGSTEILDLVARMSALKPGSYVIADPSYNYWTASLDSFEMKKIKVPLDANWSIDLNAMLLAIDSETRLVYICNPNNPTGTLLTREALADFIKKVPASTTIVIDEAYLDYTKARSISDLVNIHPNLLIAKTLSKIHGLAGARIGYAIAHKEMINQLSALQSNTNNSVSVLSKLAATASLQDKQFLEDSFRQNEQVRNFTTRELEKLNCRCIPSHTNFIYFSIQNYQKDYFQLLKENNILGTGIFQEQGKWTRITVGTRKEMEKFISVLKS